MVDPWRIRKNRIRKLLWINQDRKCFYCPKELLLREATIDHLIPKRFGGTDHKSNLVVACLPCNRRKADASVKLFKMQTKRQKKALETLRKLLWKTQKSPLKT